MIHLPAQGVFDRSNSYEMTFIVDCSQRLAKLLGFKDAPDASVEMHAGGNEFNADLRLIGRRCT